MAKAERCSHSLLSDLTVTGNSYFRERSALCCPDFPLAQVTSDNGPATKPCCPDFPLAQVTSDNGPATKPGHCCQNILLQNYYYFSYYANHRANNLGSTRKRKTQSTLSPPLFLRSSFALPPYQSRCKVGERAELQETYIRVIWDFHPFCEFLADLTIKIWRLEGKCLSLQHQK